MIKERGKITLIVFPSRRIFNPRHRAAPCIPKLSDSVPCAFCGRLAGKVHLYQSKAGFLLPAPFLVRHWAINRPFDLAGSLHHQDLRLLKFIVRVILF